MCNKTLDFGGGTFSVPSYRLSYPVVVLYNALGTPLIGLGALEGTLKETPKVRCATKVGVPAHVILEG